LLDLKRLELLLHVVETGSVTAAAEKVRYSASAVSQQVRRLEKEVGQPLFERQPRGMVPTEAGKVLAEHARRILRELDDAAADLAEIAGLRRGVLEFGTIPTVGSAFIPPALSQFKRSYPAIEIRMHSAREDDLLGLLDRGRIGLSVLWEYEWQRVDKGRFLVDPLFEEQVHLVVAADHPAARRRRVTMASLAGQEWVAVGPAEPIQDLLSRTCREAGFEPLVSFHANDYQEMQAMVSVGLGIALAPRSAVHHRHPGVRLLSVPGAPSRRIVLARRQGRMRTSAESAFQRILTSLARDYRAAA
jgi:LysR family transcriptional activator of glutamate synthase operon